MALSPLTEVRQAFIGRQSQLSGLEALLGRALAGNGQVAFVVGEPGAGKSALVMEFTRRAQAEHADLVVAFGDCNATSGEGDAYLPFREIMTLLSGDVEPSLAEGVITAENASRLGRIIDFTREALIENGPDLVGIFVPGGSMLTRMGVKFARKVSAREDPPRVRPGAVEQSQVLQQFTNVVRRLANAQPLILVVDDLHWADSATIDLLFHLSRRIEGSRVLIIGTYRPSEVAQGRAAGRHPLEAVVNEVKRYYGDVQIDLDTQEQAQRESFVNDLIDREPNQLDEAFRAELFAHTQGHALFTVELLQALKERGALQPGTDGRLASARAIDWSMLPGKVEGIIAERVARLSPELRQLLDVASVEGEEFTAEVAAAVRATEPPSVVHELSAVAERVHRMVRAQGVGRIGAARLSHYRFQHSLFQTYLYNELDQIERSYKHEAVGHALEKLYGADAERIAVPLGHHFERAGDADRAVHYLTLGADASRSKYAHREAAELYDRALALLDRTSTAADPAPRLRLLEARADELLVGGRNVEALPLYDAALQIAPDDFTRARLQRKAGRTFHGRQMFEQSTERFFTARKLLDDLPGERASAWWQEWLDLQLDLGYTYYFGSNLPGLSEVVASLLEPIESFATVAQHATFLQIKTMKGLRTDRYRLTPETLATSSDFARVALKSGDLQTIGMARFQYGFALLWADDPVTAEGEFRAALEITERTGHAFVNMGCLTYLTVCLRQAGDVEGAATFAARARQYALTPEQQVYAAAALANQAWVAYRKNQLEQTEALAQEALLLWSRNPVPYPFNFLAVWPLAAALHMRGDTDAAWAAIAQLSSRGQRPLTAEVARAIEQRDMDALLAAARALGEL